jgi:hypothetical protein
VLQLQHRQAAACSAFFRGNAPVIDPDWESSDVGLQEMALGYMGQDAAPAISHLNTARERQRAHGRERLGHRIGPHQAAGLPPPGTGRIPPAAPQIHHPRTIPPRGNRRPGPALPGKHVREAHRLEPAPVPRH